MIKYQTLQAARSHVTLDILHGAYGSLTMIQRKYWHSDQKYILLWKMSPPQWHEWCGREIVFGLKNPPINIAKILVEYFIYWEKWYNLRQRGPLLPLKGSYVVMEIGDCAQWKFNPVTNWVWLLFTASDGLEAFLGYINLTDTSVSVCFWPITSLL